MQTRFPLGLQPGTNLAYPEPVSPAEMTAEEAAISERIVREQSQRQEEFRTRQSAREEKLRRIREEEIPALYAALALKLGEYYAVGLEAFKDANGAGDFFALPDPDPVPRLLQRFGRLDTFQSSNRRLEVIPLYKLSQSEEEKLCAETNATAKNLELTSTFVNLKP